MNQFQRQRQLAKFLPASPRWYIAYRYKTKDGGIQIAILKCPSAEYAEDVAVQMRKKESLVLNGDVYVLPHEFVPAQGASSKQLTAAAMSFLETEGRPEWFTKEKDDG